MDKKLKFFLLFIVIGLIITGVISYYTWFYEPEWYFSVRAENNGFISDDDHNFQVINSEDLKNYPKLEKALMSEEKVRLSNSEFEEIRDFLGFEWEIHTSKDFYQSESPFIFLLWVVFNDFIYKVYFFYET